MSLYNYKSVVLKNYVDVVEGICKREGDAIEKLALMLRQALTHMEFGLFCGEVEKPRILLGGVAGLLRGFSWDEMFVDLDAGQEEQLRAELLAELVLIDALLESGDRASMALAVERIRAHGAVSIPLGVVLADVIPRLDRGISGSRDGVVG